MSGVIRGILIGAGGALGICSQTESLNDVPRFVLRSALSGYDKLSHKHTNNPSSDTNVSNVAADELKLLSREIADLKLSNQSARSKPIVVYGGSSSTGVVKLVVITTTGVVICYYFGYGFNDIMYVTKAALSKAVKNLEEKVGFLGVKLEKTRNEIFAKISSVEESIFSTSKDLQTQIDSETGKIKTQIGELDSKFQSIELSQDEIKLSSERMGSHMSALEAKFDINGKELEKANSGIKLLINSVMDLPHVQSNKTLMGDLRKFVSDYTSTWFGSREDKKKGGDGASSNNRHGKVKASGLYSLAASQ